jgi:hypothetical protein
VGVALVKDFAKNADKEVVSEAPKKGFDWAGDHSFAFVDAFMGRKGLDVWKNYRAAVGKGLEAEAILGSLFWQVKSAIVASRSKSASESGLAPFVYTKSKKITEMWSGAELADLAKELIRIYHDSHRGIVDAEISLEKLVLTLSK